MSTCLPPFPFEQGAQGRLFFCPKLNKKHYTKPWLSYEDQLEQLENRGLYVPNRSKANHVLSQVSYYRLSGYWYPLMETPKLRHEFKEGASFETAFKLYCFDREFRQLMMNDLEKIEIALRAKVIYIMSQNHGVFWLSDKTLFKDQKAYQTTIKKIKTEYDKSDSDFAKSFKLKYSDPLPPSWILLEVSSFGSLSHIYKNIKSVHSKRQIADSFGVSAVVLESWIHSLIYVRNICAHHSRLWNRLLGIRPEVPRKTVYPFLKSISEDSDYPIRNDKIYFVLGIIQYLLHIVNPKNTFKFRLQRMLKKYPNVDIVAMGFPKLWRNDEFWRNTNRRFVFRVELNQYFKKWEI